MVSLLGWPGCLPAPAKRLLHPEIPAHDRRTLAMQRILLSKEQLQVDSRAACPCISRFPEGKYCWKTQSHVQRCLPSFPGDLFSSLPRVAALRGGSGVPGRWVKMHRESLRGEQSREIFGDASQSRIWGCPQGRKGNSAQ